MREYVNQYASYNTLYHSGEKKKTAHMSCFDYYFLALFTFLLDIPQTLLYALIILKVELIQPVLFPYPKY